jgi:hypothetical protein
MAARAETGVLVRTDRVRACPVWVGVRVLLVRDGDELGEDAPSAFETRPTPPEGGFLGAVDMSVYVEL